MGFDKLGVEVEGMPLLGHSIAAFQNCETVGEIVLVTAESRFAEIEALAAARAWTKLRPLVPGGVQRHDSVRAGLAATNPDFPVIAVHDGARPLVTPELIQRCAKAALTHGAASAAAPVIETLKRRDPATGHTAEAVDRTELWGMQTPQAFRREILIAAYEGLHGRLVTDEASAVEIMGKPVMLIDHPEWNVKVTYPKDLPLVALVLSGRLKSKTE